MSTNMSALSASKRQSALLALIYLFLSKRRYLELATKHDCAVGLAPPDMAALHAKGEIGGDWLLGIQKQAEIYRVALKASFLKSMLISMALLTSVLVLSLLMGFVSPELPFSRPKSTAAMGAFFAVWAGILQSYPAIETYKGVALHEEVYRVMIVGMIALTTTSIFAAFM